MTLLLFLCVFLLEMCIVRKQAAGFLCFGFVCVFCPRRQEPKSGVLTYFLVVHNAHQGLNFWLLPDLVEEFWLFGLLFKLFIMETFKYVQKQNRVQNVPTHELIANGSSVIWHPHPH